MTKEQMKERLQELDYLVEFTTKQQAEYDNLEAALIEHDWCIEPVKGNLVS